jgi:hypothetical protein
MAGVSIKSDIATKERQRKYVAAPTQASCKAQDNQITK